MESMGQELLYTIISFKEMNDDNGLKGMQEETQDQSQTSNSTVERLLFWMEIRPHCSSLLFEAGRIKIIHGQFRSIDLNLGGEAIEKELYKLLQTLYLCINDKHITVIVH